MNESPAEPPPLVTIQFDDQASAPEVPGRVETPKRRGAGLAIGALALVAGFLLWSANSDTEQAAPDDDIDEVTPALDSASEDAVVDPASLPSPWAEFSDDELAYAPMGDFIVSPVRGDDGWLALRQIAGSGSHLVFSEDGLTWKAVDSDFASTNLFGLDRVGDTWRTMVNSAALNEQRFSLLTQTSVDSMSWETLTGAELHSASGNRPTMVDMQFGNSVVVGDQPLRLEEPVEEFAELLSTLVSPDIAERACKLELDRQSGDSAFSVLDCAGEMLGRVSVDDRQQMNTLSTVAFLLQFESVVIVQLDGQSVERVRLPPGEQVASVAATADGFVAVVIDTIGGVNGEELVLESPPGKLVRWTLSEGLVDVSAGLDPSIDLVDWFDNGLRVSDAGDAFFASPAQVFRASPPYVDWTPVLESPMNVDNPPGRIAIGPDGSGVVFQDELEQVWVGRTSGGWVRAPQLDGSRLQAVLLSSPTHIVGMFELSALNFQLVRFPVPAPVEVDPHSLQTIAPVGNDWLATSRGSEPVLRSTDDGRSWTADSDAATLGIDIRSLGRIEDRTVGLVTPNVYDVDVDVLDTWVFGPDGWEPLLDRETILVESGRVTRTLVGELSIAVVEDRWQSPVPEVTTVLAQFVPESVAAQTCAMNRTVLPAGGADYDLIDCEGNPVGQIAATDIEVGGKDDDLLAFTQEVLRTRTVVYVAIPGREVQVVELPPSQLILDITLTESGFVAFILDSSEVLGNVDILYSQSFAALLIGWEAGDGPVTPFATPIQTPVRASAWSLNEVHANPDGSLTVISPIGLHRAEPPFDSWTLLSAGPIDPPLPGRIASSAVYGDGFFMPDPRSEDFFYASDDGETWTAYQHDGANLRRMLIATDEFLTFDTVDRTIVRIEREP